MAIDVDGIKATAQYSHGEVAAILGLHRNTITKMVKRRVLRQRHREWSLKATYYLGRDILDYLNQDNGRPKRGSAAS